ncbi:hypothetical protein Drorol1_Dr00001787 [Drosera rotundifolia]
MASKFHCLSILFGILFHVCVICISLTSGNDIFDIDEDTAKTGFGITIHHRDAGKNLTRSELLKRAIQRGELRLQRLKAVTTNSFGAETPVDYGNGEYVMTLSVGRPAKTYTAIVDTGSDLIWTQCKPCQNCFTQPTPIFDPTKSATYKTLNCKNQLCKALPKYKCSSRNDCSYFYQYGDGSFTIGDLSSETFTFGTQGSHKSSLPSITFGCGNNNQGTFSDASGLVGLGGGPLSLASQMPLKKFSYCLTNFGSSLGSTLYMGALADSKLPATKKTFSLVTNSLIPTFYYLPLEGITVGDKKLAISSDEFAVQKNGTGGVIMDSGTTITYLSENAVSLMNTALSSQIKLRVYPSAGPNSGLAPCWYKASKFQCPKLVIHFKGGVDWDIPCENYLFEDSDNDSTLLCNVIQPVGGPPYIIGNIMQQNNYLLYNLAKRTLTLAPTQCKGR